jgi:hypothetical protein
MATVSEQAPPGDAADPRPAAIDLQSPLSLRTSFRFPLQSALSRREIVWGAVLLVALPGVGWLLNMGHRIQMVHRMQHGLPAWPAWTGYRALLRHGAITFAGMAYWHAPGGAVLLASALPGWRWLLVPGALLTLAGTMAVPGYMTHYCRDFDVREVFSPLLALRRIREAGGAYWRAWGVALAALGCSLLGLLGLGLFFFVTSVWFWQVAGFSFATVFTARHRLRG